MITFRAHVGGGGDRSEYTFPTFEAMLTHPWIDGWKTSNLCSPYFIRFSHTPYHDGWNLLMVELRETPHTHDSPIGYFKVTKQPIDLPTWEKK